MSDPIQLEITPVTIARSELTAEQVNALISIIASSQPSIIEFPADKSYAQVKTFTLNIRPNASGSVSVVFKN